MNRFTRWQTTLVALALGAVALVGGCTDEEDKVLTNVDPTAEFAKPGVGTTFEFSQCANEASKTPDYCDWVFGSLGAQNSRYREGDVVPQRFVVNNVKDAEAQPADDLIAEA